jgi:hypothetical protein
LVSFGDTMTTLLAFFIVLCSLAEEQTGADLYSGTGSFVQAIQGLGLPGRFRNGTSSKLVEKAHRGPRYIAPDPDDNEGDRSPTGPDQDNGLRVIDRETESFQRFLNELERMNHVEKIAETEGEVVFDFFNPLPRQTPFLSPAYREAFQRILPTLRRDHHEVDLIVWATTPSPSAWQRAVGQATALADEVAELGRLSVEQRARMRSLGKAWRDSQMKRPMISVIIRKVAANPSQG